LNRLRQDRTQAEQAKTMQLSRQVYGDLERSTDLANPDTLTTTLPLEPHERCLLYRRRLGHTQQEISQVIGVSRWWCNLMERGLAPSGLLVKFWESPRNKKKWSTVRASS
jgi:DNA-binding XRE family transcriptional regulator